MAEYIPKDGDFIMDSDTHQIIGRYKVQAGTITAVYDTSRTQAMAGVDLYNAIGRAGDPAWSSPVVVNRLGRYYVVFHAVDHPVLGLILEVGAKELEHCADHKHFSLTCNRCLEIVPKENENDTDR